MARDLLKNGEGRFFRGNLHCHSNRSDGFREPEEIVGAYRDAGYDFVCLSDHFEAGRYYSTQGPSIRELLHNGGTLHVETSEAYAISLTGGGDRWQSGQERHGADGEPITEAEFDLTPFRGSYCRLTVVDPAGRSAWSNPVWP